MQNMEQIMRLSQELHLSPALLQSMKLLQMNTDQLADYINTISMENPTIEFDESGGLDQRYQEWVSKLSWFNCIPLRTHESLTLCDATSVGGTDSAIDSLSIFLRDQLARLHLSSPMEALCNYLVELLDEHGYLLEEDLSQLANSGIPTDMLSKARAILQSLEPAGLAANNLSECLQLQLSRLPGDHALSRIIVSNHLDDLSKGHYHHISQQLSVSVEEIHRARLQIQTLNANPIQEFECSTPTTYVSPDAWVAELDGSLQVMVNQWTIPRFHLCQDYVQLLEQKLDQETEQYLRQKIQQTQWLLHCIERRHTTLEGCLFALVSWHKDFFLARSNILRPLFQWQLAESISVHPSTLSRAIRNKYLQCKQGTFPLSYFFSKKVGSQADAPSEMEIKVKLAQLISDENPTSPLSDEKLRIALQAFGIDISRRTVAKYRSELGLNGSHLRKIVLL